MICKYTFFNIWKEVKQKIGPSFLRFVSILFLILEKGNKQKIVLGFVSILFLIFEKGNKQKSVPAILRFVSILFNVITF